MSPRPRTSVYIATSLDGFIARPDGAIDWLEIPAGSPADGDYGFQAFFDTIDTVVLGRMTFEKVLTFGVWPYEGKRVVVLSARGVEVPPHLAERVRVSAEEPTALVESLAREGARHLYVDGGRTIQSFLRAGLLDELTLTVIPVLLGEGLPLFGPVGGDVRLAHLGTRTFSNGMVQSRYRVAPASGDAAPGPKAGD